MSGPVVQHWPPLNKRSGYWVYPSNPQRRPYYRRYPQSRRAKVNMWVEMAFVVLSGIILVLLMVLAV